MIRSSGNDQFKDNTFDYWTWSAPVLQTPEEVIAMAHELKIVGRFIQDIQAVGSGDDCGVDGSPLNTITEAVRCGEGQAMADIKASCATTIDDPILIRFADGDVLGIDFSDGSTLRMGLNSLPWDLLPQFGDKNFHANQLFKDIIGRRISDFFVTSSLTEPEFTGGYGLHLSEQSSYVQDFAFECQPLSNRSNDWLKLVFGTYFDCGTVSLKNRSTVQLVPPSRFKAVIEGYLPEQ